MNVKGARPTGFDETRCVYPVDRGPAIFYHSMKSYLDVKEDFNACRKIRSR